MPIAADVARALRARPARAGRCPAASRKCALELVAVRRAVEVVHVDDVDALEAQALPAVVERAQHAGARVVVRLHERAARRRSRAARTARARPASQQASDLGRQQERFARHARAARRRSGARTVRGRNAARCRSSGCPRPSARRTHRDRFRRRTAADTGCRAARRPGRRRRRATASRKRFRITGCTLTC